MRKPAQKTKRYLPAWKIKREFSRIKMQVTGLLPIAWYWALKPIGHVVRPIYDRANSRRVRIYDAAVERSEDIALFLIYSPNGLMRSHIHTLRHFVEKGFSPFVVVNHPVSEKMLAELRPYCWKVMERPNIGYDFGGYRDAILHLSANDNLKKNLLVMNDSVWFPLYEGVDLLDQMREWPENLVGFVIDHRKRVKAPSFIQSFCFMYDESILHHPAFLDYWRSIILTRNKNVVIRHLEMRMTEYFRNHGFSVKAYYEYSKLGEFLSNLPEKNLLRFLNFEAENLENHAIEIIERINRNGKNAISADEWQMLGELSQVEGHLLKLPPELLFDVFDCVMLKKLRNGHFVEQRAMIMNNGYQKRFVPVIREEFETWDSKQDIDAALEYRAYLDERDRKGSKDPK